MFRNPRENAARVSEDKLKPSAGRAPSPPVSTNTALPVTISHIMPPKTKAMNATPAKAVAKVAPSPATKTTRAPKNAKTKPQEKGNGNGNIMAFFRKVSEANESLFLDDGKSRKSLTSTRFGNLSKNETIQEDDDNKEASQEETRFHESGTPSKRRKTSHPSREGSASVLDELEEDQSASKPLQLNGEEDRVESRGNEVGASVEGKTKRAGPFLDDSDSEDETPAERVDTEESEETDATSLAAEVQDEVVAIKHEPSEEQEEQEGDAEDITQEYPPGLLRQGTSYAEQDEFGDLEGNEDFDEEYVGGEEFSERRFAKEQRRLEMLEGGVDDEVDDFGEEYGPDSNSIKEEPLDDGPPNGIPACPICASNLAGLSDQEASVHVNHCLDGNPTPLPVPKTAVKEESESKAAVQPASAKFRRPVRAAKAGQENPFTFGTADTDSTAFSKLMSGNNEELAWATAAAAEHASRGKPAYTRTCPFYKILPGFYICVDAFRYGAVKGCNAYFLSHFHSDHYIGLTSSWTHGPIYCSRVTANLVKQQLRVDPKYVIGLDFEQKVEVPGTQGVFVTMIPANHCPGSSLYLYEKVIKNGAKSRIQRVLHCGDFRACPAHVEHPLLKPDVVDAITGKTKQQKIDVCYLDTTYLNPKYAFPSQEDVIQAAADMCVSLNKVRPDDSDGWETMKRERAGAAMAKFVRKDSKEEVDDAVNAPEVSPPGRKKTGKLKDNDDYDSNRGPLLVVVGTYSIGKERVCLGIARALKSKIYAPPGKQRIVAALEDPELSSYMTKDPLAAQVHMTPLFEIRAETLGDYLNEYKQRFSRCVGFRPSGWNYRPPGTRFTESPAVSTVLYGDNWSSAYSMKDLTPQRGSTSRAACFGIPYSEHSSFRELTMFVSALRIEKVIPTVNIGSAKSRQTMKAWCDRWAQEQKKSGLFKVVRNEGTEGVRGAWYADKGTWTLRTSISDSTATSSGK
jgi:DNA cross-link repair 1A protein